MTYDKLVDLLCSAEEYKLVLPRLSKKDIRNLLESHMSRHLVENETDKLVVASRATTLLQGMLDIAEGFKDAALCEKIIHLERCIVQAVPVERQAYGTVLQFPGVKIEDIEAAGGLEKYEPPKAALEFARIAIPRLVHLKSYFKVPGEKVVPPQAQSHVVLKFMVVPYGAKVPEVDPALLEDATEESPKVLQDPLSTNELAPVIPYAHAPYFPGLYRPSWYGFVIGERENKIIDGPAEMKRLSYENLQLSDKELADGTKITIATFKIQVTSATPPYPGTFAFKVGLYSSGYFGCDIVESVNMLVENPPPEPELEPLADLSDDESADAKASKSKDDDESSDEEEDLSDIDTDTEDEDEAEAEPVKTK
jgi:translocation protein SEC63